MTYWVIKFSDGSYFPNGDERKVFEVQSNAYRWAAWFEGSTVIKVTRKPRQVFEAYITEIETGQVRYVPEHVRTKITILGRPDTSRPLTLRIKP